MSFSKRVGLEPEKKILQFESMDDELRRELHNVIRYYEKHKCWDAYGPKVDIGQVYSYLWSHFFILENDEFAGKSVKTAIREIKEKFFQLPWNNVYDYIEVYCGLIRRYDSDYYSDLVSSINIMLAKHTAAYRFVDGKIVPLSDGMEIEEVRETCHTSNQSINHHMKKAVTIFTDRDNHDYPNTVKEAISAVEAAANIVSGTTGKTLADALKVLDKKSTIHPSLKEAFIKIYGYTSDERSGIRHAMTTQSDCIPDFADAKFMLVACSAFINYLLLKAAK